MGDRTYYPDEWNEYVRLVKIGHLTATRSWNIFAARYRAAGNYAGSSFFHLKESVSQGYEAGIRLMLCYGAFEAACKARGTDPNDFRLDSEEGFYKECRQMLRSKFGKFSEAEFPLRSALSSKKLSNKVDDFFANRDSNLQPVAAAFRHLFAHGVWTPTGSDALSKSACEALNLLSQQVLHGCDQILREFIESCLAES